MYKKRACVICGAVFAGRRMGSKCCSVACRGKEQTAKRVRNGQARCSRCKEWKRVENFSQRKSGLPDHVCRQCHADRKGHAYRGPAIKLTPQEKKRRQYERSRVALVGRRALGKMPHALEIGAMFCEQDARCVYCGQMLDTYHIDHKTPVKRGGTNAEDNLHLTCPRCNLRKGTMTHDEFLVSKKRPVRRFA